MVVEFSFRVVETCEVFLIDCEFVLGGMRI